MSDEYPWEDIEMSVPGLNQLLRKALVDKSHWLAIQKWCDENGAVDLEDIRVNLDLIAVAAVFPKCAVGRIRRHAEWPPP